MLTKTPESILDAAEPLFARSGFAGTTTRQIARAARCNVALIAYHFGGKQGLYKALFSRYFRRLRSRIAAPKAQPDYWPELTRADAQEVCALLYEFGQSIAQNPHMHQMINREMLAGGAVAVASLREGLNVPEMLKSKLTALCEAGALKRSLDPRFGALALAGPIIYSSLAAPVLKEIYGFEKLDETYLRSLCVNLTRTFFESWGTRDKGVK
jgi:TetR/AcrR family transcriptional regulator